jgi:hypothetical protein
VSPNIRPYSPEIRSKSELEIPPGIHRLKLELFGGGRASGSNGETGLYIAPAGSDAFRSSR